MTFLNKILSFLKDKKYVIYAIITILIISGIFVFNNKKDTIEIVAIRHADFVNQVSISGHVIASSDVSLGFSQGGRVSSVRVKVGDTVNAGSVLSSVENGDLQADLAQKEAILEKEQLNLKSLQLGTRSEQIAITESSVLSAQTSFNQARESVINSINDAYTKSDDAIKNKIDQFFNNPSSSNPSIVIFVSDSSLLGSVNQDRIIIGNILNLWKQSIAKIDSSSDLDRYVLEVGNNMNKLKDFLAEVSLITNNPSASYSNGSSIPSSWKSDTSTARLAIDTSVSNLSGAFTSYKNAQSELTTKQNNLKLEQAGATKEDIDMQIAQMKSAQANVDNARASLQKTLIIAPFSGIITKIDAKVGEVASINAPLVQMMSVGTFQIESFVPEVNIAVIKLNNEAKVTLDAYGSSVLFNAKVVSIDPAETIRDGVSTYKVKLQFNEKDERIKSGMTANVSIITFDKPNVIVVPGGVILDKAGKKFVQVKVGKNIEEREVVIGSVSSLGQAEIVSGLSDGDQVILKPDVGRQESQTSNVK
ncbi:MAG: efflux RND transporter periplasmic adaptor subunit [Candidatus Paceibacterota bacterium]|jgi:RND family efflux transporter MFP subunit